MEIALLARDMSENDVDNHTNGVVTPSETITCKPITDWGVDSKSASNSCSCFCKKDCSFFPVFHDTYSTWNIFKSSNCKRTSLYLRLRTNMMAADKIRWNKMAPIDEKKRSCHFNTYIHKIKSSKKVSDWHVFSVFWAVFWLKIHMYQRIFEGLKKLMQGYTPIFIWLTNHNKSIYIYIGCFKLKNWMKKHKLLALPFKTHVQFLFVKSWLISIKI